MLAGFTPVVPMKSAIECNFDIAAYLSGKVNIKKPEEIKRNYTFLYSRKQNTAIPWVTGSVSSLDFVVQNIGMLLSKKMRGEIEMIPAVEIAHKLLEDGYVYFVTGNEGAKVVEKARTDRKTGHKDTKNKQHIK